MVVEVEAENVPALYFYGQAIRARVERKSSLQAATDALNKYLRAGAPLGHRAEVQAFLAGQTQTGRERARLAARDAGGPGGGPGSGTGTGWASALGADSGPASRAG